MRGLVGKAATAQQPRWWRSLLRCQARTTDDGVVVRLTDGRWRSADSVDDVLSQLLGRKVVVSDRRPAGATVERPDPELVLSEGVDADIEPAELEIAQGALRIPAERNRIEVAGFGVLPCAGLYAKVLQAGVIHEGDEIEVLAT